MLRLGLGGRSILADLGEEFLVHAPLEAGSDEGSHVSIDRISLLAFSVSCNLLERGQQISQPGNPVPYQ